MWLDSEQRKGRIEKWEYEKNETLKVNGKTITNVMWDFKVFYKSHYEFHEMKGAKTGVFRLKEKLFRALYPNVQLKIIPAKDWSSR